MDNKFRPIKKAARVVTPAAYIFGRGAPSFFEVACQHFDDWFYPRISKQHRLEPNRMIFCPVMAFVGRLFFMGTKKK